MVKLLPFFLWGYPKSLACLGPYQLCCRLPSWLILGLVFLLPFDCSTHFVRPARFYGLAIPLLPIRTGALYLLPVYWIGWGFVVVVAGSLFELVVVVALDFVRVEWIAILLGDCLLRL